MHLFFSKFALFPQNMQFFLKICIYFSQNMHALLTKYVLTFSKNALTSPKNIPTYFFQTTHILSFQNTHVFFSKYVFIFVKIYTTYFSKICTKHELIFPNLQPFFKNMHLLLQNMQLYFSSKNAFIFLKICTYSPVQKTCTYLPRNVHLFFPQNMHLFVSKHALLTKCLFFQNMQFSAKNAYYFFKIIRIYFFETHFFLKTRVYFFKIFTYIFSKYAPIFFS